MAKVGTSVIVERLDYLREEILSFRRETNEHLCKLNGKVASHEKYINMSKGGLKIISFMVGGGALLWFITFIVQHT